MQTLYIDVYFLINLTVDLLAIYFALMLSGVVSSRRRLILSSFLGASVAVVSVLFADTAAVKVFLSAVGLLLIGAVAPDHVPVRRRARFLFSFIIFSALFGAGVTFLWDLFDSTVGSSSAIGGGTVNRRMLLFALAILVSIGVFKMIISFFTDSIGAGKITLELSFMDKQVMIDALIDSGNLAVDPMDMRPVLIIKPRAAENLLPHAVIDLCDPDILPRDMRKRIRLIPISRDGKTHVLTGVRIDRVRAMRGDVCEDVAVTVAIDKEGGDFGGYEALMPSAALCNVGKI